MGKRTNHKYLYKTKTKNGNIRYVYGDTKKKQDMLSKAGGQLLTDIKNYVSDEFRNKYKETETQLDSRRRYQRDQILNSGKRFIEMLCKPVT